GNTGPTGLAQIFSPAFGNFFTNTNQTLVFNTPMFWHGTGGISGGVFLDANQASIHITQAGLYFINFQVSVDASSLNSSAAVGIFINDVEVPNNQSRFGIVNFQDDRNNCPLISGGLIVPIPAASTIQLRSVLGRFNTCQFNDAFLDAAINLIKLDF
ncbi:hypothetical protein CN682_15420, partial [Bacillus toyonensis]